MKIFILLYIIFMFSCEEQLGVEEYQEAFNYYDFVAYGWAEYKNQNYLKAIDWFNESMTIDDVDQDGVIDNAHHSAYVGLSWAKTQLINSDFQNSSNDRVDALKYLLLSIDNTSWNTIDDVSNTLCQSGTWENEDCIIDMINIDNSDNFAEGIYDINDNVTGIMFCQQDYCCSDCFIKDKKVSLLYYYLKKFNDFISIGEFEIAELFFEEIYKIGDDLICLSGSINDGTCNIDISYNFMNGKPIVNPPLDIKLDYTNIIISLGNLYIEMAEFSELNVFTNPNYNDNQQEFYCNAASILTDDAVLLSIPQCADASCNTLDGFIKLTSCIENIDY